MDPQWEQALAAAVAGQAPGDGPILFVEERVDAVARFGSGEGRSSALETRSRGLSVSSAGYERLLYRGDAVPDDAAALLRALEGTAPPGRLSGGDSVAPGHGSAAAALPLAQVAGWLEAAARRVRDLAPQASVEAEWVGFRQEILVTRPGAPLGRDVRHGGRVRLQARGAAGRAVAEAVLPLDLRDAGRLVEHLPEIVASRLAVLPRARAMASGERPVVLAPGLSGILAHEIVGHALEADVVLAGRSWLGSTRGPVAAAELTVIDDPRRSRAPWKIDDEGEPTRPVALLRRGCVDGWLQDGRTSRLSGRPASGHARRASFRDPARPRMGCTFVAAGPHHPLEALEGIQDGVYVRRMEAAATDPCTGTATFRVTDADRIREGKIEAPLVPHLMLVDGARALASIDRVAGDVEFDPCAGSCVREGQALSTSVGGPTLRLITAMVWA